MRHVDKCITIRSGMQNFLKYETSIRSYDIDHGKMNIAGVSSGITGYNNLIRVMQVGISKCGRWPYQQSGRVTRFSCKKIFGRFAVEQEKVAVIPKRL